jgi:hypothetical protein
VSDLAWSGCLRDYVDERRFAAMIDCAAFANAALLR